MGSDFDDDDGLSLREGEAFASWAVQWLIVTVMLFALVCCLPYILTYVWSFLRFAVPDVS